MSGIYVHACGEEKLFFTFFLSIFLLKRTFNEYASVFVYFRCVWRMSIEKPYKVSIKKNCYCCRSKSIPRRGTGAISEYLVRIYELGIVFMEVNT